MGVPPSTRSRRAWPLSYIRTAHQRPRSFSSSLEAARAGACLLPLCCRTLLWPPEDTNDAHLRVLVRLHQHAPPAPPCPAGPQPPPPPGAGRRALSGRRLPPLPPGGAARRTMKRYGHENLYHLSCIFHGPAPAAPRWRGPPAAAVLAAVRRLALGSALCGPAGGLAVRGVWFGGVVCGCAFRRLLAFPPACRGR